MRKIADGGRRDSLAALADSINETGRMARANVSLTLVGALYLALTLLSAKDENLLQTSAVTPPQLETGISLELSCPFAPVVFLYLHMQTLFLLAVLARKVRTYDRSLARLSGMDGADRAECRDWLSAVSLAACRSGPATGDWTRAPDAEVRVPRRTGRSPSAFRQRSQTVGMASLSAGPEFQ